MAVSVSPCRGVFFLCFVVCFCLNASSVTATNGLRIGFYHRSCPSVEEIIFGSLYQSYKVDQRIAPGILRLAFHDCFVRGCDCSIMLDGPNTEKQAIANTFNTQTYAALDCAKKAVEKACPGVVSCSDVLQYAARDAVILSGGHGWAVPAGRRDGCVSKMEDATVVNLPSPLANSSVLIELFERKGLSADQMVALSGAHTIGSAKCVTFDNRIQVPNQLDPTLDPEFALSLTRQCPAPLLFSAVFMDSTPHRFDTQYFHDLVHGRGLMSSDHALLEDHRTRRSVYAYRHPTAFSRDFARAMVVMSKIEVLTGRQGEIRRRMSVVNGD